MFKSGKQRVFDLFFKMPLVDVWGKDGGRARRGAGKQIRRLLLKKVVKTEMSRRGDGTWNCQS